MGLFDFFRRRKEGDFGEFGIPGEEFPGGPPGMQGLPPGGFGPPAPGMPQVPPGRMPVFGGPEQYQPGMTPSMPMSPIPIQFGPQAQPMQQYPQQYPQQDVFRAQIDLISSKMDNLKASLDRINESLDYIERYLTARR